MVRYGIVLAAWVAAAGCGARSPSAADGGAPDGGVIDAGPPDAAPDAAPVDAEVHDAMPPPPPLHAPRLAYEVLGGVGIIEFPDGHVGSATAPVMIAPELPPIGNYAWSPRGQFIELRTAGSPTSLVDLRVMPPGPAVTVLAPDGSVTGYGFGWVADESRLLFVSASTTPGYDQIWVAQVGATIGTPERAHTPFPSFTRVWPASFSPDGSHILFLADGEEAGVDELYVVDVTGMLPATPVKLNPALSPGGDLTLSGGGGPDIAWCGSDGVLFRANLDGDFSEELWYRNLAAASAVELTANHVYTWQAAPDCSGVAFTEAGAGMVYVPIGGGVPGIRYSVAPSNGEAVWSPNSSHFAFQRQDGVLAQYLPATDTVVELDAAPNIFAPLLWSSGGRYLAYRRGTSPANLFVVRFLGVTPQPAVQITSDSADFPLPAPFEDPTPFSTDERWFFYSRSTSTSFWAVDLAATPPEQRLVAEYPDGFMREYYTSPWAPNTELAAYQYREELGDNSIYVMDLADPAGVAVNVTGAAIVEDRSWSWAP